MTIPSSSLAEFVSNGFAILNSADEKITELDSVSTRTAAEYVLRKYSEPVRFTCEAHVEWGMKFSSKIITNIFYNNKQQIATANVRMDVTSGFKSRQRFKLTCHPGCVFIIASYYSIRNVTRHNIQDFSEISPSYHQGFCLIYLRHIIKCFVKKISPSYHQVFC